uniref:tRNA-binding domain-containing protein n=1 Tax=Acanthochromis polyacanthus TaxID=80966 RepID=A0A3Q1F8T0_9TELE
FESFSLSAALLKLDPEDGEQIMEYLKTHVLLSREKALLQASVREQKKLLVENAKLKKDIEQLRVQLQEKQRRRTVKRQNKSRCFSVSAKALLSQSCSQNDFTSCLQLPGSLVVLLCNVKPCKLRGVASQARLLCCSSPDDDDLALLLPPSGSAPGDRVTVTSYHGNSCLFTLKKVERLQVDLQVDGGGVASYKGGSLQVKGKGRCRGPALTCCCLR